LLEKDLRRLESNSFQAVKIQLGSHSANNFERLQAVRKVVGPHFGLFVDADQLYTLAEAMMHLKTFENLEIGWLEDPFCSDNLSDHIQLSKLTKIPIAVGKNLYSIAQFREFLQHQACSIVQVDVARIGGITPWIKVAHLAEAFNVEVSPQCMMELHVSLCCGISNSKWLEYRPQLEQMTHSPIIIKDGHAFPSQKPGIGIDWDFDAIQKMTKTLPILVGELEPIPLNLKNVKRFGNVIGVREEKLEEYEKLHANVWPGVLSMIKACHIDNYSIFIHQMDDGQYYLFSYFEYSGANFEEDMKKMAADETTKKWWSFCEPCQKPLQNKLPNEWWSVMRETWHQD